MMTEDYKRLSAFTVSDATSVGHNLDTLDIKQPSSFAPQADKVDKGKRGRCWEKESKKGCKAKKGRRAERRWKWGTRKPRAARH